VARTDKAILGSLVKHILEQGQDPLTPIVDRYLTMRELPGYRDKRVQKVTLPMVPRERTPGRLSPSSVCGCERQAAMKFIGMQGRKKMDPQTELIFEDGNWRHHKWQYMFSDMAVLFPRKFRLIGVEMPIRYDDLKVAGHLDAHIEIYSQGEWHEWIVDFKGANTWAYESVFKNHEAKAEHLLQLACYMKARGVRKGMLLYDSKNSNDYIIYTLTLTKKKWLTIKSWCENVVTQMDRKQLPPVNENCHNGNFLFGRCMFKDLCFGKMTPQELERKVYAGFSGVEELWAEHLLEIDDDDPTE